MGQEQEAPQTPRLDTQMPEERLTAYYTGTRRLRSWAVSKREECQAGHCSQPEMEEYKLQSQRHSLSLLKIEPLCEEPSEGFWSKSIFSVEPSRWFTNF